MQTEKLLLSTQKCSKDKQMLESLQLLCPNCFKLSDIINILSFLSFPLNNFFGAYIFRRLFLTQPKAR